LVLQSRRETLTGIKRIYVKLAARAVRKYVVFIFNRCGITTREREQWWIVCKKKLE